jgi:hypothetical protein
MLALKHNWNHLGVSLLASSMGGRGFKTWSPFLVVTFARVKLYDFDV